MDLKRVLSLCAAVLLVAGAAGDLFAVEPVRIQVVEPATGTYAIIGDTISINVLVNKNAVFDSVRVALSNVLKAEFGRVEDEDEVGVSHSFSVKFLNAARKTGSQVDSFLVVFPVTPGNIETVTASEIQVHLRYSLTNDTKVVTLDNQSTLAASPSGVVGDLVEFGVDNRRPLSGIVTDVSLEGGSAASLHADGVTKVYGIGDTVKVVLSTTFASGVQAKVFLLEVADTSTADHAGDALKTYAFTETVLLNTIGDIRDSSLILEEGSLGSGLNGARVKAIAFVSDDAGNLGGTAATSTSPIGVTDDEKHVVDTDAPDIKIAVPVEDGRFTGAALSDAEVFIDRDSDDERFVTAAKTFAQNPADVAVDEIPITRYVIVDGDTTSTGFPTFAADDTLEYSVVYDSTDVDGDVVDFEFQAVDSVGNVGTLTVEDAILDNVGLEVSGVFPSSANEDTINAATADVIMRIDEVADSISIRYIELVAVTEVADAQIRAVLAAKLSVVDADFSTDFSSNFGDDEDGKDYTLQIFAKDLAGNISLTRPDTLTFDDDFQNPQAHTFKVEIVTDINDDDEADSVIVGEDLELTITAWDTALNKAAITFKEDNVLVSVSVPDVDEDGVAGVALADSGQFTITSDGGTVNSDGTVSLDEDEWSQGKQDISISTETVINDVAVAVQDTSTEVEMDPDTGDETETTVFEVEGEIEDLNFDAAEFSGYAVSIWQGDVEVKSALPEGANQFTIKVTPVDEFGNPSGKIKVWGDGTNSIDPTDARVFLATRIDEDNVLDEIFIEFSTNIADANLPQGPQNLDIAGGEFTGFAPLRAGTGMAINVRTANVTGDPTGIGPSQQSATGSSPALAFGGAEPVDPGDGDPTLAAPANLVVQDYKGPEGDGDQGGYVVATFPSSAGAAAYRISREIMVNTSLEDGAVVVDEDSSWAAYVPWAKIGAIPGADVVRAVIPSLDNEPTKWAVTAEGRGTSSAAVTTKRVFTKESVQLMVQFLGVDPNRVITHEELSRLMTPPKDFVSSIIGDQKNLVFAALDVDVSSLLSTSTLPQSIRTASHGIISSAPTATAEPVGAVDNIAPTAVTELEGELVDGEVSLEWAKSTEDRIVGFSTYRGHVVPIAGVERYEVWRSADGADAELLTPLLPGADSFRDENLPEGASSLVYRIDALDTNPDNRVMSETLTVLIETGFVRFATADGTPVYVIDLRSGRTDFTPGFPDFVVFAQAFGLNEGDEGYILQGDTNQDKTIGFPDFVNFAQSFGVTPTTRNGQPIVKVVTKLVSVSQMPGVNQNAEMLLSQNSDRVIVGQPISVDVSVANVEAMQGFGFVLTYDSDKFEFVGATPAEKDLLKSGGGQTPLFFEQPEAGRLTIANAVINNEVVSGEGSVVSLTFKVLQEFEDNARFEITEGIVFDHNQLSNPMVVLGALNVETTPTEFSLLQNFPNPFNPETTIKYNLAEGADVNLRIYNIVGQVVRTMVADRQSAGRYQVQWNGTDDRGMPVSSGIYFYQISAGNFQDVKRLMLLK